MTVFTGQEKDKATHPLFQLFYFIMEESETQRSEVSDWGPPGLCSREPLAGLGPSEDIPNLSAP